jgi:excisionase family DNA binding protein
MNTGGQSPYLSTAQAAEALGVSVSTVKRWVDEGVLPSHRTAGGHRKLLRAEVMVLAREGDLPRGDLGVLAAAGPLGRGADATSVEAALHEAVFGGQGPDVTAIVRRAYSAGLPLETLADRVIAPVMAKIGHDWERTRIDVWQEHRGTQLCAAALFDLKDELTARAERGRPVALGGAPEGDPYILPTLLAELVLLDSGWDAVQLGPNTPLSSLGKALEALQPRMVWLSASHLEDEARFIAAYHAFHRTALRQSVAVAIGGRALAGAVRTAIPYTTYGDGLSHLGAFARTLHPRPKRPRRGRPPKR